MHFSYRAPPVVAKFLKSDAFMRLICGPQGCLTADTEFLTPRGWVRMAAFRAGDEVMTWAPTGEARFQPPLRYIVEPCESFLHFSNKHSLSMVLSDEHRVPLYQFDGKFVVKTAAQVAKRMSRHTVPTAFAPIGTSGIALSDDEIRLAVAIMADAYIDPAGQVNICLRKQRKKDRLAFLLDMLSITYRRVQAKSRPTEEVFRFHWSFTDKQFRPWWYQASHSQLQVIIEEISHWDGLFEGDETVYYSRHRSDADFIQYAAHATGGRATISRVKQRNAAWADNFAVHIALPDSPKSKVMLRVDTTHCERVPSPDGMKYCFETSTGFFVARHNGCVFVTGNSGKSSGSVIELLRRSISRKPDSDGIKRSKWVVVRNCFDDTTEILTEKRGWQLFKNLLPEDRVASLHGDEMKFELPRLRYAAHYAGEMIGFQSQNCNLLVTPDHFMWAATINGRTKKRSAFKHEMAKDIFGKTNREFRATADWRGGSTKHTKEFFEFLGLWFAEGSAGVYKLGGREHLRLNISQKKYTRYVERVLGAAELDYTVSDAGDGNFKYILSTAKPQVKRLARYLASFGTATVKRLPVWVKNAPAPHIKSFLKGYIAGDGHVKQSGHDATMMWTSSEALANDLHELVVRVGMSASVTVAHNQGRTQEFNGRTIHGGSLWRVAVFTKKRSRPQARLKSLWRREAYDGMVYCVEVSTHVVYVRRGGVAVWCGQTVPMLRDTTIPTFLRWFPHGSLGQWHMTDKYYHFRFGDVDSQVLFRALDDKDDIGKLLSSEYTGCYFNEFREINYEIYEAMTKRVGRWVTDPHWTQTEIDQTWSGIWADTNPPQVGSWLYQMMEKEIPNKWDIFRQPSGRSPDAENADHLRSDYYDTDGLSEEYIRVMIDGEYGYDQSGLPVFNKVFLPQWHVTNEPLRISPSSESPLVIGMDAGLTPAAVIGQQDYRGRLLVVGECYTNPDESMGMERFVTTRLLPYLRTHFPLAGKAYVTADPAINHRSQANELTPFDVLSRYFHVAVAWSDKLPARISAAESWLAGQIDGKPKVIFDPRTSRLQKAMAHGYRYAKKRNTGGVNDEIKDTPDKNHPDSDLCFVAGTPVLTPTGPVPIDRLRVGDEVCVPDGVDRVIACVSHTAVSLQKVALSDGATLICTPSHPFHTKKTSCFLPADTLRSGDELTSVEDGVWASGKQHTHGKSPWFARVSAAAESLLHRGGKWLRGGGNYAPANALRFTRAAPALSMTDSGLGSLEKTGIFGTSGLATTAPSLSTFMCGKNITAPGLKAARYTISTETQPITTSAISTASIRKSMHACTSWSELRMAVSIMLRRLLLRERLQRCGTDPLKGGHGIQNTPEKSLFVVESASLNRSDTVFSITVERTHTHYAGSALVHNCDGFMYLCMHASGGNAQALIKPPKRIVTANAAGWT